MKKNRFIEQVNLYLDCELPAEEAETFFEAIRANADYHQIYRDYCQIHNACTELSCGFAEKRARSTIWQRIYAVGGMAAAFALLFMAGRNLAPIVSAPSSGGAIATNPELAASSLSDDEILTVLQADFFEMEPLNVSALLDTPVRFDVASFEVAIEAEAARNWEPEFSFRTSSPLQASTFEHELLSSAHSATGVYGASLEASPFSFGETDSALRFDIDRMSFRPVAIIEEQEIGESGNF